MNYQAAILKIYPDADFNPACFNFTEEEAREKKLWRDARAMPTTEEITDALVLVEEEKTASQYKSDRALEYNKQGLSFDSFVEMLIEGDTAGMNTFKQKRDAIKANHPKPQGA